MIICNDDKTFRKTLQLESPFFTLKLSCFYNNHLTILADENVKCQAFSMYCIPIVGPTLQDIKNQVNLAIPFADILEFPLDLYSEFSLKDLSIPIPFMFSCQHKTEEEIELFAKMKPDYFQLNIDKNATFIQRLKNRFPEIKWIISSYHNFEKTPDDLSSLLKSMPEGADLYKIACMANSTLDALKMLCFIKENRPLLGISMGEKGSISRILGPIYGAPFTFTPLSEEEKTALGQIPIKEFNSTYNIKRISKHCDIYALIGSPILQSPGHIAHNKVMQTLSLDSIYVKLEIVKEELSAFFDYAKKLPFKGLSVTIPLKEEVLDFLDAIDPEAKEIGAVNTICIKDHQLFGYNTDGMGALNALEETLLVKGKKVAVIGSGGSAKAIIYEAKKRGAVVYIFNRTEERARALARKWSLKAFPLNELKNASYDILINTTPSPILKEWIRPHSLIMDISLSPLPHSFLKEATSLRCTIIGGYAMWIHQAALQYEKWLSSSEKTKEIKSILESLFLSRSHFCGQDTQLRLPSLQST